MKTVARVFERGATWDEAEYVVIWYHGFGADGYDCQPIVDVLAEFGLSNKVKYLFAEAHPRLCNIEEMPGMYLSWYDYKSWFPTTKVEKTVDDALVDVAKLVQEVEAKGIPANRIVLGGFSQGAALSVDGALKNQLDIGGIVALSCDFPLSCLDQESPKKYKIFFGHGQADMMVSYKDKDAAAKVLRDAGHDVVDFTYPRLQHSMSRNELRDVYNFLRTVIK